VAIIKAGTAASSELDVGGDGGAKVSTHFKPEGYVPVTFRAVNFTAATTEAMITLTPQRDYVDAATGTSFTVTSGKRLRLTSLTITTKNAGAAGQGVQVRVRVNPSGASIVTSPVVAVAGAGTALAVANVVGGMSVTFPDDWTLELEGAAQLGISQIGTATAGNDVLLNGYEYTP
jgi:hypothetical protein